MAEYHYFVAHEFSRQEKDDLRAAIEKAFQGTDLRAYYADIEFRNTHILSKIKERIFTTQFGIYDISNSSKPNVFIELGLAMAAEKPFYIICKKGSNIPADLAGLDRIEYESYRELTALIKAKITKTVNKPRIEVIYPQLKKVNSWNSPHIKEWLKKPIGRGQGKDDFLFEFHGKIHPVPSNCEVRIWICKDKMWPQIGGEVSEEDGTWRGKVFLRVQSEMEKIDIGVDLFTRNSAQPICSKYLK